MTPFASNGLSTLVATGGWHSSSGLPMGGVTSQENTAARSPVDSGVSLPEAPAGLGTVVVSSHEVAPSRGALCRKLRRDVFGIQEDHLPSGAPLPVSKRIGEQSGSSPPECLQLGSVA